MATADEILAAAIEAEADKTLVIDNDLRTIQIPAGIKNLGVESDDGVLWLHFRMPSMYGSIDLSAFRIRINYMNAQGEGDVAEAENVATSDGYITFSWKVERHATAYKGSVRFIVCLKKTDDTHIVTEEFNTTVATLPVLEGLETTEQVVQDNPDVLEGILARLSYLETYGTGNGSANKPTSPVKYVESLDTENLADLRSLETGNYVLYGYFKPFPGSASTLILDNLLAHVYWADEGSYISYMAADGDVFIMEILVDETNADGYTFERDKVSLLEVRTLLQTRPWVADVNLPAANWQGDASPYHQVVAIDGTTEYSQVELNPSVEQLTIFYEKDLTFVTENDDGVVTVYAIGQKPENDYTIQATIREVRV